ncbi:hypothetical protein AAFF_G00437910 [Aldrovandia affinis]|uniref:Uncharacterized protein n=1 Tax=Aldrovandia affinis TaxID=143900 RepID=A0AAD7WI53_9TELE|nr:hypothetical protein AAFF_G00437910 [Aldrovandia affinis]
MICSSNTCTGNAHRNSTLLHSLATTSWQQFLLQPFKQDQSGLTHQTAVPEGGFSFHYTSSGALRPPAVF